ncbi:histidine kinase [Massilia sp. Root418]|jgi:PAS domain S-box-containing protein|uniref:PAS domain S-box protein n=1 Tax=Massilia sp. Root418 TaxID=1736532 RepID=UPI0006F4D04C|nr:PAS domain-containing protein [Massilia sp. Root418]KQW87023.1 histidine kinase [Massilia sp. Root418]
MQQIDYQKLVESIGDAVVVCDAAGAIIVWNDAAVRMFGFTREEALGKSLDIIIPERQRQRHWDGYNKSMSTGETRYGNDVLRVPALHRDGRNLSIAFTVAMLYDEARKVTAIVAVVRDETQRWSEERQMRIRLAQLEARIKEEAREDAREDATAAQQ